MRRENAQNLEEMIKRGTSGREGKTLNIWKRRRNVERLLKKKKFNIWKRKKKRSTSRTEGKTFNIWKRKKNVELVDEK